MLYGVSCRIWCIRALIVSSLLSTEQSYIRGSHFKMFQLCTLQTTHKTYFECPNAFSCFMWSISYLNVALYKVAISALNMWNQILSVAINLYSVWVFLWTTLTGIISTVLETYHCYMHWDNSPLKLASCIAYWAEDTRHRFIMLQIRAYITSYYCWLPGNITDEQWARAWHMVWHAIYICLLVERVLHIVHG